MRNDLSKTLPPQATDLEEVILGACLLESEIFKEVVLILTPKMFYKENHRIVFEAMQLTYSKGHQIDLLTINQALKAVGKLDAIGGPFAITEFTNRVASSANTISHCRIIQQQYFRREVIIMSMRAIENSYDEFNDIIDIMTNLRSEIANMQLALSSDKIIGNVEIIDNVVEQIKEAANNGGIVGISTGMKSLDLGIMGLRRGLKYVFAALPGEGKTSLAKSICLNMADKSNIPGVFFSLEMTKEQLMMACISEMLQIPNTDIQKGRITPEQFLKIEELKTTFFAKNFIIDDRGGLDPIRDIRPTISRLVDKFNIQWFVIDYLGLCKLKGNDNRGKTTEDTISIITSEIKNICKEFNLIGIEISQFSREQSKRTNDRPKLTDLKGSAAIEANADVVLFPYRPEYRGQKEHGDGSSTKGFAELIIAKNRFGKIQSLAAKYHGSTTSFTDHEEGLELDVDEAQTVYF